MSKQKQTKKTTKGELRATIEEMGGINIRSVPPHGIAGVVMECDYGVGQVRGAGDTEREALVGLMNAMTVAVQFMTDIIPAHAANQEDNQ